MKLFLATIALIIAVAFPAAAQFGAAGSGISAITNLGTWAVAPADGGGAATNIPTTQARWVPLGAQGFGVAIKSYATNAALTTNVWITLEFTADGTYAITNNNVTVVLLPRGTATNVYYTNFVLSSSATIGSVYAVRAKNIMQTNGVIGGSLAGNLFIESFLINTR